jgi:cellulose synthase (UDP-forming)
MSLAAMAAMIVLWLFLDGPRTRFVFLALGSLVVLRYILWRVTDTLPSWRAGSASRPVGSAG